jgi:hypothetical protein
MAVTGSERNMMPMEKHSKFGKVILYQNIGFLVVIGLVFVDELVRLSSLLFWDQPFTWEFRRSTLAMLLVLAVWFVVGRSTRRVLERIRFLEQFMRVCAWCRFIDYKGDWIPVEEFLKQGFDTPATHGMCPKCLEKQRAAIRKARAAKRKEENHPEAVSQQPAPGN